jgi:hypothetical protein
MYELAGDFTNKYFNYADTSIIELRIPYIRINIKASMSTIILSKSNIINTPTLR